MKERKNVFDLLAIASNRNNLSEAQKRELRKNVIEDFIEYFYSRYRFLLFVIRRFRLRTESRFFVSLILPAIKLYLRSTAKLNYQDVLDSYLNQINKTLDEIGVNVKIDGINDLARWSNINAEYASWFGMDQRITILSGTMYFSHLFSRSFQPLFVSVMNNKKRSVFQRYFKRMFQRASVGFLTNNHRKGLSPMFLIPEDGSLLYGMEKFIICHEIGHAYFCQYGISAWPFAPLTDNIRKEILGDEEVGADLFAINTMWRYYLSHKDEKQLLFGGCFFFLIFSWFEEEGLVSKPTSHPQSIARYNYLMSFIQNNAPELYNQYVGYQNAAEHFWRSSRETIIKEVNRYKEKEAAYKPELDQVEAFTWHYFACQSEGEEL